MKQFYFILPTLVLLASCSSDDIISTTGSEAVAGVVLCAEDFHAGDAMTRSTISSDYKFSWDDADAIGIYPNTGTAIRVPVKPAEGQGSNTAVFDGGDWVLKSGVSYSAFYPVRENVNYFNCEKTSIPVKFTGQVQGTNNSTAHLGAFDYMVATPQASSNGNIHFTFQHVGALLHIPVTVAATDKFASLTISATDNSKIFVTEARLNTITGELSDKVVSNVFTLNLNDIEVSQDGTLDMWMMMAPISGIDWSTTKLTFTVKTYNGAESSATADGANFEAGKAYSLGSEGKIDPLDIPFVTFTAESTQTLRMSKSVDKLEYSVNGGSWIEFGTTEVTFGGAEGDLRLRGKSSIGTATSIDDYSTFVFGNNEVNVVSNGDIRTLVDYEKYATIDTKSARFCCLFSGCTSLTEAPELPATTLARQCYENMFSGCTSLTEAPVLPAITLSHRCYKNMFFGCTSLTQAPELPATTLGSSCYSSMFSGCTSLTGAPELPVTTLESSCYSSMFSGCTSLIQAIVLPATILAGQCYENMFSDCSSLTEAPELPATTIVYECYRGMFSGCTSLTQVPELPATTLAWSCYSDMFWGCTSLTQASELPATTLAYYCYQGMFSDCTSLTQAPELPATTLAYSCYSFMFSGCTSLTQAPELPATTLEYECYRGMFSGCSKLSYVKMLASDISVDYCLFGWLGSVASIGIFVKNSSAEWNITGSSGVPSGWTIIYEDVISNGHEYVDLGLKDSEGQPIYWATCNIGANSPEEYGQYFQWGATEGYYLQETRSFSWSNYPLCQGSGSSITKYNATDKKVALELEDDAAYQNWKGNWRIPTSDEVVQLISNCTWTWETLNGVEGYMATSMINNNSVFFPAAGYRGSSGNHFQTTNGSYWSSSLRISDGHAYTLVFNKGSAVAPGSAGWRSDALVIRPVCQ